LGDTIIAYFDSIPANDTVSMPRIRLLVAIGHASSLQHLPPRDTALRKPAINYVCGKRITVAFDSAKVKDVKVEDSDPPCGGMYVEPESDSSKKAPPGATPSTTPARTPPGGTPPKSPTPTTTPVIPPKKP
jgi:hypothetical protein